ncbi:L-threonylcarbamoyladenylate synthase [Thermotoga sp. RQ2]|uniref:L-threonylcarbamoyladenylate synthase n=1 Tax=Thermotoga sp. (strain RQ2) TaxID=126740 RepID=UPI0001602012|nr:L-threonylcarbamoyladenylate synthase [Thermotoga sp. RQ2]ACB08437.1 Sua5/YciO/YrdC/YwlC family protein [Thermotoga sp. RQ2]
MTRVLKVDPLFPDEKVLKEAVELLQNGEVIIFPTETVYGIGADAYNEEACKKIFELKGRPADNPLIVHIHSFEQLEEIAEGYEPHLDFLKKFWPGPLTVILRKKSEKIPPVVTAGLPTVAMRMPAHPVALKLIELFGHPIAAPSANISGRPSATNVKHVVEDFMGKVKLIIDAGDTPFGLESTIVDLTKEKPVLLRPGPVEVERLKELFPGLVVPDFVRKGNFEGRPLAPGMKYRHYAPLKPLILVEDLTKMEEVLKKYPDHVVICVEERKELYDDRIVVGSLKKPYSIAQNIFSALREAEKMGKEYIIVEGFEERGILFAVMNRLRKAATEIVR